MKLSENTPSEILYRRYDVDSTSMIDSLLNSKVNILVFDKELVSILMKNKLLYDKFIKLMIDDMFTVEKATNTIFIMKKLNHSKEPLEYLFEKLLKEKDDMLFIDILNFIEFIKQDSMEIILKFTSSLIDLINDNFNLKVLAIIDFIYSMVKDTDEHDHLLKDFIKKIEGLKKCDILDSILLRLKTLKKSII